MGKKNIEKWTDEKYEIRLENEEERGNRDYLYLFNMNYVPKYY